MTENKLKKKYSIKNELLGFGDVDMESPIKLEDFKNPYEQKILYRTRSYAQRVPTDEAVQVTTTDQETEVDLKQAEIIEHQLIQEKIPSKLAALEFKQQNFKTRLGMN